MLLSPAAAAMPGDKSPQGHALSTWVQLGLGGFGATGVCRVLAPATCEPFIGVNLVLCMVFSFWISSAASGRCHVRDQVLLRAAKKG